MRACVLLPLFNEAAVLGGLIDQIRAQSYRVVVADDGSTDNGAAIARVKGATVLSLGKNCGKGVALRKGFEYLLGQPQWDIVVLMDSDGQHDPGEIEKFIRVHQQSGADVVVGNRMGVTKDMPWIRRLTNRFMSYWVSRLAGCAIPDSQCGFRSLRRHVLEDLQLTCERFDLESEMLILAGRKGHKIASVEIRTIYQGQPSRIRPVRDTLRFIQLIMKSSPPLCKGRDREG